MDFLWGISGLLMGNKWVTKEFIGCFCPLVGKGLDNALSEYIMNVLASADTEPGGIPNECEI